MRKTETQKKHEQIYREFLRLRVLSGQKLDAVKALAQRHRYKDWSTIYRIVRKEAARGTMRATFIPRPEEPGDAPRGETA